MNAPCPEPNHNPIVKKSFAVYSDDEESPESMFIREKCLADKPVPKDINELKEKSRDLENELAKLRNEFNETNDVYESLKNVSYFGLIAECSSSSFGSISGSSSSSSSPLLVHSKLCL